MADQRAAPLEQAGEQPTGLLLVAVERHLAATDADLAKVDVALSRSPGRRGSQQGRRPAPQPLGLGLQAEGRLLAGTPDELADPEIRHRLRQAAFELVAFDLPLDALQPRLEGHRQRRQAAEQERQ